MVGQAIFLPDKFGDMKNIFLFSTVYLLVVSAGAASNNCDFSLINSAEFDLKHYSIYTIKHSEKTVTVGGPAQRFPQNMDRLAAKRGLIVCAPGFVKCMNESKGKLPQEFNLLFQLNPAGEIATASQIRLEPKSPQPDFNQCMDKVLSDAKFGLIIKEPVQVTIPVKIQ